MRYINTLRKRTYHVVCTRGDRRRDRRRNRSERSSRQSSRRPVYTL